MKNKIQNKLIISEQFIIIVTNCLRLCITLILLVFVSCGDININQPDYYGDDPAGDETMPDAPDFPGVPPDTSQVAAVTNRMVRITYSEAVNADIATNKNNYIINGLSVIKAEMEPENPAVVNLATGSQNPIDYTLLIINIEDLDGNRIKASGYFREFHGLAPADASLSWKDPTNPAVSILAPPMNPAYNKTSIYAVVSGADIAAYRYKLDDEPWSDEIRVDQPINITGLAEGAHAIIVTGKHSLNYWQETEAATGHTWIQDTIAPYAAFFEASLPANPTSAQSINIQVIGQDVASYYYCLDQDCDTDTWTGPVPRANSISRFSLVPGIHKIRVRGIDRSGNEQSEVLPESYEWVINLGESTAFLDSATLPPSFSNIPDVNIYIEDADGIIAYKAKIVEGTDCGTGWAAAEPERDLTEPITTAFPDLNGSDLTGDPSQEYTVCVVGMDAFGNWQDDGSATSQTRYTWTVDTTGPDAGLNWINPYAQPAGKIPRSDCGITDEGQYSECLADLEIEVFGDDVVSYRYALLPVDGTSCSSAFYSAEVSDLNTHIVLDSLQGDPETQYTLCVVGKDSAGNWQPASLATSSTWTIDLVPPAVNPSFTEVTPVIFTSLAIHFDWSGGTGDTAGYRIQVATDSSFEGEYVLLDQNIGDVTSFNYAVNPNDGPSYYARLRAADEVGNYVPLWSDTSAEHYVTGNIVGIVEDYLGAPVAGVTVELLDKDDNDLGALYTDQTTGSGGEFEFQNIRIGKLAYKVRVAAGDLTYSEARKSNISVNAGVDTQTGKIILVPHSIDEWNVYGKVVDGDDGWMLGNAEVKLIAADGTEIASVRTNYSDCNDPAPDPPGAPTNIPARKFDDGGACGDFSFINVPAGTYTIAVTGDSWGTDNMIYNDMILDNIAVYDNDVDKGRIPLVSLISGQDLKFVLQWGTPNPIDLDFHVVGSLPLGEALADPDSSYNNDDCDDSLFHVWAARPNVGLTWQQQFSAKTNKYPQGAAAYSGENYFPKDILTTTALTQDANSGYGPEAINFYSGYKNGTYWFTVINWSLWYYSWYGSTIAEERWDVSNASIRVYDAEGLVFEVFAVPPSGSEEYVLWQAFKMNISGNGPSGRQFEIINNYVFWNYHTGRNVLDSDKCELSGF